MEYTPHSGAPIGAARGRAAGAFLSLLRWWLEHQRPYTYTSEQMHEIFQRLILPGVQATARHGDEGLGAP